MSSNNENCCKCLKAIKGDSICCSTCNKWYHFKCSNLKKEVFKQHAKNDQLIWDCFCLFCFFNWDSPHARLNSHYKAWSYKKRSTKRITGYRKSV